MTNTGLVASAAMIAIGVAAGGLAMRPQVPPFDAAREGRALLAPHEERIERLEADLQAARRGQASAERQAAEALSAALDARRDLERLRDRTDDLFAVLDGMGSRARAAGGGASGGVALGSVGGRAAEGATGTAVAGTGGVGESAPHLAVGMGRVPTPDEVDVVKKAMEQLRQEESTRRRAQQAERRKQFLQQRIQELAEKIGLSPQQAVEVQAIYETSQAKRDELFQGMREGTADPAEMRAQMETLRTDDEKRLQETLSAQQYQDLQRIQEEERAQRGGGPGGGPGGFFGGPGGGPGGGRQGGGGSQGGGAQGGGR